VTGLALAPGTEICLDGDQHTIVRADLLSGSVVLRADTGEETTVGLNDLITAPTLTGTGQTARPRGEFERLDAREKQVLQRRLEHLLEVDAGYRSGSPLQPRPGEPRPAYDPAMTDLTSRRKAKVAELDNPDDRRDGYYMSFRTLCRKADAARRGDLDALVDRRHVRPPDGRFLRSRGTGRHTGPHSQKRENTLQRQQAIECACWYVWEQSLAQSSVVAHTMALSVQRHLLAEHEHFSQNDPYGSVTMPWPMPNTRTITRWFQDRLTASQINGNARHRASAITAPSGGFRHPNPQRPGELVLLDTNSLDVLLKGTAYDGQVKGALVLGVDWYSRSIVVCRVVEHAETALDVTFAIRDMARPKAMLPGWPETARWPFIGLPEQVLINLYETVADGSATPGGTSDSAGGTPSGGAGPTLSGSDADSALAGDVRGLAGGVAGLPIVNAENIVTDHGQTYKAGVNINTAARYGINILPARKRMGSDKAVIERTFGAINTMLLQHLAEEGYKGSNPSQRGTRADETAVLTAQHLEDMIMLWAVLIWQNHPLRHVAPDWAQDTTMTPNRLYEAGIAQAGFSPRFLDVADYCELLPAAHVKVHPRGVKVRNLWYDSPALDNWRLAPAPYGGTHAGKWTVRVDGRDRRRVYWLDAAGKYQPLTWTGVTPHTPNFGDADAKALTSILREARTNIDTADPARLNEILIRDVLNKYALRSADRKVSKRADQQMSRQRDQAAQVMKDQNAVGSPLADAVTNEEPVPVAGEPAATEPAAPAAPVVAPSESTLAPGVQPAAPAVDLNIVGQRQRSF